MDNRTRENAIEKLKSMEFRIGYPDEILIDDLISKYYRDVLFLLLFYYLSLFIISFCKSLYQTMKIILIIFYELDDSHLITHINCYVNEILVMSMLSLPLFLFVVYCSVSLSLSLSLSYKYSWRKFAEVVEANAFYFHQENTFTLNAGILQGMFFNRNRPE